MLLEVFSNMPPLKALREDESGVSEVVGTILTLAITVVLFTSVFAAVNHLEAPEERDHAELDASFERTDERAYINITHHGGKELVMEHLTFALFVEGTPYRYEVNDPEVTLDGEDPWSPGEQVVIEEDEEDIVQSSTLDLLVRNDETARIVYDTSLVSREDEPVSIDWTRIRYRYDWRDYAEPDEEIDIRAKVVAEDMDPEDLEVTAQVPGENVFEEDEPVEMEVLRGNIFNRTVTIRSGVEIKRHSLKVTAEMDDTTVEDYVHLNIGEETVDLYQPNLEVGDIDFSPGSPSHGDEFTVSANVYNHGRVNYTAEWEVKDNGEVMVEGVTTFTHGPAPTRITANYEIEGHGPHDIEVNVSTELHLEEDMDGETEDDVAPESNRRRRTIHVDPYIRLVRDALGGELREGRIMENALRGLNLDYSVRNIRSADDIPDDSDIFRDELNESSVVIWMTGNRTDELNIDEPEARQAVYDFIEEDGGAFWLIGSNFDGVDFGILDQKLGFSTLSETSFADETLLEPGGEEGTYGDFNYTAVPGEDYMTMGTEPGVRSNDTLIDNTGDVYGLGYIPEEEQRTAVNSFLFENVMDPGQRSNMASEVIKWLTNMTIRSGVDIAISSQRIDPTAPMYMDEVVITATLRNNGPEDLYVTVRCERNGGEEVLSPEEAEPIYVPKNGGTNVTTFTWTADELGVQEFIVYADYFNEIDEVNLENNDITYKDLDVTDDEIEVNVHYSTLVVDADLSEYVGEYYNATSDVIESFERLSYIEGRDYDYHKVGMMGGQPFDGPDYDKMSEYNAVFWITGERDEPLEVFTDDDLENLKRYSTQPAGSNLMFVGEHILDFLEGDDFLEDVMGIDYESIGEVGHESNELRGIEDNPLSHGLEYELAGDPSLDTFETEGADVLFEDEEENPLASIYDDGSSKVVYMGVNLSRLRGPLVDEEKYEDWPAGEVDLTHQSAREEFVYTTLWQFGKGDDRAELRVIDHDIVFSTDEPHTGRSYEIRADIQNIGYRGASALVRIKEGEEYVGAESIFIEGSQRESEEGSTYFEVEPGSSTLEITWRPTHGGYRDIRVRVDPVRATREISEDRESEENKLMEFHNQAAVTQPVYFFYDDMEKDGDDWDNERILMNIDGSSPLSFLDRDDVDTNVVGEWDESMSGSTDGSDIHTLDQDSWDAGVFETDDEEVKEWTDKAHYSSPRSFWMPEVEGQDERQPMDIVVVIDCSGSMDRGSPTTMMDEAKIATQTVINMLQPQDRIALFPFSGAPGDNTGIVPFTHATQENKDNILNPAVSDMYASGWTALYDTIAVANEYMDPNFDSNIHLYDSWSGESLSDDDYREEAVVGSLIMTDGISNNDGDYHLHAPYTGSGSPEGSCPYAPNNDWESTDYNWHGFNDPYPGSDTYHPTEDELDTSDGYDSGQYGGLGMPWNVNAVGFYFDEPTEIDGEFAWTGLTAQGGINWYNETDEGEELEEIFANFIAELSEEAGEIKSEGSLTPHSHPSTPSSDSPQDTITETLWMRNDELLRSDPTHSTEIREETWEGDLTGYWGIEAQIVDGAGTTIEDLTPGGPEAVVSMSWEDDGYTMSATWTPPEVDDVGGGDMLEVTVCYRAGNNPWVEAESFVTDEFGEVGYGGIEPEPWTIYYRVAREVQDGGAWGSDDTILEFHYGHETWSPSRIEDAVFKEWDPDDPPPPEERYDIPRRDYRFFTTDPVEIRDTTDITMSFRNKFWMTEGTNGGVIYLLGSDDGNDWSWEKENRLYVKPEQSYTGNLRFAGVESHSDSGGPLAEDTGLIDAKGDLPYWCFNGRSAGGTFGWRYDEVDIGRYIDEYNFDYDHIRVMFLYARYGGLGAEEYWRPSMGWYVDNVQIRISPDWEDEDGYWTRTSAAELEDMGLDPYGEIENYYDHTLGNEEGKFWMFGGIDHNGRDYLPTGVDSSLYTAPISLRNAKNPELIAHLKFNIDPGEGVPPDGLRVEISSDDGRSWDELTYGVRTGWGASGDDEHGGYSGDSEDGEYGWVNSQSLVRLDGDLSGWRGENVIIRFRVFTNLTVNYEDSDLPRAIFIDDVVVKEKDMDMTLSDGVGEIEGASFDGETTTSSYESSVKTLEDEMIEERENELESLYAVKETFESDLDIEFGPLDNRRVTIDPNTRYVVNDVNSIFLSNRMKEVKT